MSTTQQQSLVTVTLDGTALGIFDSRTGGADTAEVSKYRSGGMSAQKTRAALSEVADVVVSRDWEEERDAPLIVFCRNRAGRGNLVVSDQRLTADGASVGKPDVYTGKLSGVETGDRDANSNDPTMLQLTGVMTLVS